MSPRQIGTLLVVALAACGGRPGSSGTSGTTGGGSGTSLIPGATGSSGTGTTGGSSTGEASTSSGTTSSGTTSDGGSATSGSSSSGGSASTSSSSGGAGSSTGVPDGGGCAPGATLACQTSCGSTGSQTCGANGWGPCVPPAESCDLQDDDCNGACDDLLGCRVAVDRSYDSQSGRHFYTTTDSEAACCGYAVESYGYYDLYATQLPGLVPFYRCRTPSSAHLYTTDATCGGNANVLEGTLGYAATGPVCGAVPLVGLSLASTGDYLYTTSATEAASAQASGYASLGTVAYVWTAPGGGTAPTWPSPVQLTGSTLTTVTGFPTAWYGFPLPAGPVSLTSLQGTLSVTNAQSLYSEVLFILQQLPSGSCAPGRWPASTPEFGPPGAAGLAQFIVKAPAQGTYQLPIALTFPGGLPAAGCLLLGLNGGPVSTPQNVVSAAQLTLTYAGPGTAQSILGAGGEFCFGQSWGCQLATTDPTKSFATVTPISQATQLVALYGDISDSTFDGTASFGAPPSGAWTATNDFYVYHGADCASFGVGSGPAGPGDYYASIPATAQHLLSVPLSGSGLGVATTQVFQPFSGVPLAAGDCLVTLWGVDAAGGFDDETQVAALTQP